MLSTARSGRVLSRTLRFASSKSFLSLSSQPCRQLPLAQSILQNRPNSRSVSVFSQLRQQAVPVEEDEPQGAQREFTEFQELSAHGIIAPKIIDTITNRMKIHTMTDVQRLTINECLDGADVIAQARTGTGKTLAFLMPIVQRLLRSLPHLSDPRSSVRALASDTRALIISPTRELAEQIANEAARLVAGTGIKVQTAVGGTQKASHLQNMRRQGCHILVGTPGRVTDILSDQYSGVRLDNIETFVLDEADRLLDIGFAPAIEEIQSLMPPRQEKDRQTLMFSATVPKSVVGLVRQTLRPDFKFIRTVDPSEPPTHARVPQKVVYLPGMENQIPAIVEIATQAMETYKRDPENAMPFKAIVFFGSINEVEMAAETLMNMREPNSQGTGTNMFQKHPLAPCRVYKMSSRLSQHQRKFNSEQFRNAASAILVSSDVTARGMDFPNVTHVIQIGLPKNTDDYVHRLGRTGRAGKPGEGWLLLNRGDEYEMQRRARNHDLRMTEDDSLQTARLDMTQPSQLPASTARIMQMVESGVKSVPYPMKAQTYSSFFGVLQQQNPSRSKQSLVDIMNQLAKFGWGLEKPPQVNPSLVQKLNLSRVQGLEIGSARNDFNLSEDRPNRNRGFDSNDPFNMGSSNGRGVFRAVNEGGFARGDRGQQRGRFDRGGRDDQFGRSNRGDRNDRIDRYSRGPRDGSYDRPNRGSRGSGYDREDPF